MLPIIVGGGGAPYNRRAGVLPIIGGRGCSL